MIDPAPERGWFDLRVEVVNRNGLPVPDALLDFLAPDGSSIASRSTGPDGQVRLAMKSGSAGREPVVVRVVRPDLAPVEASVRWSSVRPRLGETRIVVAWDPALTLLRLAVTDDPFGRPPWLPVVVTLRHSGTVVRASIPAGQAPPYSFWVPYEEGRWQLEASVVGLHEEGCATPFFEGPIPKGEVIDLGTLHVSTVSGCVRLGARCHSDGPVHIKQAFSPSGNALDGSARVTLQEEASRAGQEFLLAVDVDDRIAPLPGKGRGDPAIVERRLEAVRVALAEAGLPEARFRVRGKATASPGSIELLRLPCGRRE